MDDILTNIVYVLHKNEYINSVKYFREDGTFDNVESFGKYKFYLPDEIQEDNIVIVPTGTNLNYNIRYKNKITINQFDIYEY